MDTLTQLISVTGIIASPHENNSFRIYPSPTSGQITIEYNLSSKGHFQLYNFLGQEVFQRELAHSTTQLDLSGLSNGVYLYKVTQGEEEKYSGKITLIDNW